MGDLGTWPETVFPPSTNHYIMEFVMEEIITGFQALQCHTFGKPLFLVSCTVKLIFYRAFKMPDVTGRKKVHLSITVCGMGGGKLIIPYLKCTISVSVS